MALDQSGDRVVGEGTGKDGLNDTGPTRREAGMSPFDQ